MLWQPTSGGRAGTGIEIIGAPKPDKYGLMVSSVCFVCLARGRALFCEIDHALTLANFKSVRTNMVWIVIFTFPLPYAAPPAASRPVDFIC